MPTIKELERWLTSKQAADRLGISRQGATWLLEHRRLRGAKTRLGWLVDPQDVERLRRERQEKGRR
ncbi:helix-turn-helix domain-containing protein [Rubrobacter xylanophilus]|uniref:helix-turn-helix domain-containing protein n=1 Tax=Rubrobacter xylanophilus TaxID=49319 RepID=UPI00117B5A7E